MLHDALPHFMPPTMSSTTPSKMQPSASSSSSSSSASPPKLLADTGLASLVSSVIITPPTQHVATFGEPLYPVNTTKPAPPAPSFVHEDGSQWLPPFRARILPYLTRRLPYTCSDGHNHIGIFESWWGRGRKIEPVPIPLDPAKDERRRQRAAGQDDKAEFPDDVERFIDLKYQTRDEFEAHKDDLTERERKSCEVWLQNESRWKLQWFVYKYEALKSKYDRFEGQWTDNMDPGDQFALARDQYWLSLELGTTARKLRAVVNMSSPLHRACWEKFESSERSVHGLDEAMAMCVAEVETLRNLKRPRPHDGRLGATNDVAADIEIFRIIQLKIVASRKRFSDPEQQRLARAAHHKLRVWMWRDEEWTVLKPRGSEFWRAE